MEEENLQIETRGYLSLLLDYETVFGMPQTILAAVEKLTEIPSVSVLVLIADINLKLYLNDGGNSGFKMQGELFHSLLPNTTSFVIKMLKSLKTASDNGQSPIIFYRYTNLLFYEVILTNYNHLPHRDISQIEMEQILELYLTINSSVNQKGDIDETTIERAISDGTIDSIILSKFLYQRDYVSTTDYTNQVTRCYYFFKYLEGEKRFQNYIQDYYQKIGVRSYSELIAKLIQITNVIMENKRESKGPIVNIISDSPLEGDPLMNAITININEFEYAKDDSFRQLRSKMFFLLPNEKYVLLDINFLIDYLYKCHVFGFNDFMKRKGDKNFLSIKGEDFSEKLYLTKVVENCFPNYTTHFNSNLKKKDGNPLIDLVVKGGDQILLVEFKDTLFSAEAKNSRDTGVVLEKLIEKFEKNRNEELVGIYQLLQAIEYLDSNIDEFHKLGLTGIKTIYPIIIYTDNTFGYDGINKMFKLKFAELLNGKFLAHFNIKPLTFINLNFFEIQENYLREGAINIFNMIDLYNDHIQNLDDSKTPFEVFAAAYRKKIVKIDLGLPNFYLETGERVKASLHF